jgi:hypothetical protein
MKLRCIGTAVLLCLGLTGVAQAADPPTQLTVGDQARPLDVEGAPQFGWMPASDQTAYELTVSKGGTQVWDSGKVQSSDQSYVPYAGPALANGEAYDWTVQTWDAGGAASPAAAGHFETGLTDQGWSGANWIRRVTTGNDSTDDWTYARKRFPALSSGVGGNVVRARVYVSAMGQYDVHVNGKLIGRGDNYDYPSEAQYYAFDATDAVKAGEPLTLGVLYHYWTCTCQGRANGPASNTTLSAAQAVGATSLKVGAVNVFDLGDQISVGGETTTVTAIGTAGSTGTGITVTPALQTAHASGAAVLDYAGPSGLIMKAVVDHADGTRETFVTDGTWKVSKAAEFTTATVTTRNSDAGDKAEHYDARLEQAGWDTVGFDDSAWQPAYAIGPHPRPVNPIRETFSHLDPAISHLDYETIHPKTITKLADGSVVADFGKVYSSVPQLQLHNGVDGAALVMQTSYRLNNTTLSAAAPAGATTITVASASNFVAGDKITVDQAANGFGKGNPETRTIASVSGTTITLDAPLAHDHANARFVEGSRAGTSTHDTQGSNLGWWYTEKKGEQTARPHLYWGWRYLQILPPGAGEELSADDISAVVQHQSAPADRQATFDSDNATLNAVFSLMQHSAIDSSQETFLDTPTREKGQFTGDTVDISYATMASAGDRAATARAIREIVSSGSHAWKAAASGYCTAAQLPCSYPSLGTPGRVNSVYPNGDNMRDIPDYTEFVPEWVWRYYQQTGDKATLAASYNQLKAIAGYLNTNTSTTGNAAGLIYNLFGGTSSYQYGIIDWPSQMRYGYTFTNNAARTIHNAEAVGALRAVAQAATTLGHPDDATQFGGWADSIAQTMNQKLIRPDGLYTDGLSSAAGNPQIDNTAQHAQSYPLYYGIAPAADRTTLLDKITSQGMNQGPMTWHVLLKALADGGRYDQVVKLLTDPSADGPARILDEQGTYMWEQWNPGCATTFPCNPSNNESMSHGWGSWGIVDMVEELLGIQVTGTAASTVKIQPPAVQDADLHRVSGSAWTQRGNVAVSWKKTNGTYVLDVTVPANQKATVAIPNPDGVKYVGVGAGAPQLAGTANGLTTFTVGSGATHFSIGDSQTGPVGGGVGGTVGATLALTLGAPASFGAFTPGITQTYTASTTANVTSTAGDAALTVSDPGHLTNGAFSLPEPLQVDIAPNTWSAPVSNAAVAIGFKQLVKSTDALRTGAYSKTLTFTLSTTEP